MTVEPGFGGQSFMLSMMPKVQQVRAAIDAAGLATWLQVDGGIDGRTIEIARDAGADTFVAGSAVFRAVDPAAQVELLRAAADGHDH
jgi:ribulose-phosphate 3-epimerase